MSKNSDAQRSRRQLLHQGMNAGLGLMIFPQIWAGISKPFEGRPLGKNEGPITVTIRFTAKANQADALVKQITQALPAARQAPGCRYAQAYVIPDGIPGNPLQVVLFKGWDSLDAQRNYLQWEQSSGQLSMILSLIEGEPVVEYWI